MGVVCCYLCENTWVGIPMLKLIKQSGPVVLVLGDQKKEISRLAGSQISKLQV